MHCHNSKFSGVDKRLLRNQKPRETNMIRHCNELNKSWKFNEMEKFNKMNVRSFERSQR